MSPRRLVRHEPGGARGHAREDRFGRVLHDGDPAVLLHGNESGGPVVEGARQHDAYDGPPVRVRRRPEQGVH